MHYDDNFQRNDPYDPDRMNTEALDDRDTPETTDLMEQAAWNDPQDAAAHL